MVVTDTIVNKHVCYLVSLVWNYVTAMRMASLYYTGGFAGCSSLKNKLWAKCVCVCVCVCLIFAVLKWKERALSWYGIFLH
jgi:hypothetical protein